MKTPDARQAVPTVAEAVADLFECPPDEVRVIQVDASERYDYSISVMGYQFLAVYKRDAAAGMVAAAIEGLKNTQVTHPGAGRPLVIVPYMGPVGRQICDQMGIPWLDLCGNAKIFLPGLRIRIEGRPNPFRDRGRPPNVFSSKSSRIARQLLLHPQRFLTQADLARQTGLGDGYVSKIVRRLRQEYYIDTNEEGAVRPRDPNLLLDAWYDAYDFDRHRILKGYVPARSGDELLERVLRETLSDKLEWAVTGLGAAWLYTHYAAFRLTTVYLASMPGRSLLSEMEFSDEPRGANLWLVLPADEAVFHGCQLQEGIRCVSAVQTYLDLKGQPERAKDAAVELRGRLLNWGKHGT